MARYPRARWHPLGGRPEPRLAKKNKIIMHTMVGSLWGTDSYFRQQGYEGVESHFGTDDNEVLQWQDTNYQADAQLEGNDDCISIETADHGPAYGPWSGPANVPSWTDDHLEINARLVAWLCQTHDIPCELIEDTRESTRGIGYHRQGIDPWRDEGSERYSGSFGKVCPGDRRVAQMPELIRRAQRLIEGDNVSYNDVWRTDDKMAAPKLWTDPEKNRYWWGETMMERIADAISELRDGHFDKPNEADTKWKLITFCRWAYGHSARASARAAEAIDLAQANAAKLDAVLEAQSGLDAEAIKAHIDQRYNEAREQREQLDTRLESLAETVGESQVLLQQHADGSLDAAAVVAGLRELLHQATAPPQE